MPEVTDGGTSGLATIFLKCRTNRYQNKGIALFIFYEIYKRPHTINKCDCHKT